MRFIDILFGTGATWSRFAAAGNHAAAASLYARLLKELSMRGLPSPSYGYRPGVAVTQDLKLYYYSVSAGAE